MMLLKSDKTTEAGVPPTQKTDGPFAETKELIAGDWMILSTCRLSFFAFRS